MISEIPLVKSNKVWKNVKIVIKEMSWGQSKEKLKFLCFLLF